MPLPIDRPQKIVCIGLNYRDHAEEQGTELPAAPLLFSKWPNALIGPGETIVIPPVTKQVDYEAELGVVIGERVHGASQESALQAVAGYLCLNVCPVYRKSGGDAYGPVYSGPMGAVLVPLLVGLERAPSLPHASSLCGACTEACPVKIPLHELLLDLRRDLVDERVAPLWERLAFRLWALAWSTLPGYRLSTAVARLAAPLAGRLPGPGHAWASQRALPPLARRRFRDRRR